MHIHNNSESVYKDSVRVLMTVSLEKLVVIMI